MHFCKSKKHVWASKDDAAKCCNGFERVVVFGEDIPADAKNIQVNDETGIKFSRIWVKATEE